MRLLLVADDVPNRYPVEGDGSSMITYEVLLALDPAISVTLLTFDRGIAVPPEIADRITDLVLLPLRSRPLVLLHVGLGRRDFNGAERSTRLALRTVARLSAQHDVTLLHGPQLTALAGAVRGALVVQSVDPWSLALEASMVGSAGLRRVYRRHKAAQVLAEEQRLAERARLLTVGADDARAWSQRLSRPVRSVANGVSLVDRLPRAPGPPVICFVGSLLYAPNVASVQILVRQVAPLVWATHPEAKFVIAGRRPTPEVLALASDRVEVRPNVSSVIEVFHASDLAAFPDDAGLGIRNSVTEALGAGLTVVATSVAAREQPAHPLLHVVDGVPAFAERVRLLLDDPDTPAPVVAAPKLRTWCDVAADYEVELRAALEAEVARRRR